MGSLFTNLVQKVVISRKWTENGPMLDREWTDEVAEKSVQMSTVWAMMRVKLVKLVNFVMPFLKWTKWTKWTEQIFVESAESAKSAKSIFATFATFASANFVGKASCESTVRYREWSRISLIKPLLNPYLTLTRFRLSLGSNLSRFSLASLICLCMLTTVGSGNAWGANVTGTFTKITSTDALTTGYYIIVGSEDASQKVSGATVANPNYALGNAVDNNKRVTGVSVTITSGTTISNPDEALVYLITKSSSNYTFLNVNTNKYLYQAGTTKGGGMGFQAASANFTCAGYNSSSPHGFKFTLDGASNNIFKYHNQSKFFANYTGDYSTSMTPVRLFKAYKVTYDGNGKTGGTVPTDATYYSGNGSTSVTTKTNSGNLVKAGYTFAGWNTKADGAGTHYAAGGTFTITANTTLYAQWETACANSVTISKGTETNCTFTLSKSGAQASCDGVSTTVTVSPTSGYGNPSVTQTGASAAPTITGSSNTYTVAYGANTTGTSTINVSCSANTYTITLNKDLTPTTAGTASITATYNASTNLTSAITKPTKTGWTFGGYYTAKNGGGTQIIDASGNVIASVSGYTDASKNWKYVGNITLYAKWTCTVTWSVNGSTSVYSTQTVTYNSSGSKVASIPGPPSPASYCGDKFMGWSAKSAGSESKTTSYYDDLFTTVGGSPDIKSIGDITFYAVFADYDE